MRKFWAYFKTALTDCLSYRGDIFLYTISGLALPLTTLLMWLSMDSPNSPLSRSDFVVYYLGSTLVGLWISSWGGYFIAKDIRAGRISPVLLKPVSFLANHVSNNIAEKIFKTLFLVPGLAILIILLQPSLPNLSFISFLLFLISWLLSCALYFLIDMCLGLSAFWVDDNSSLSELFNIFYTIFSGRMVPLLLFPVVLRSVSTFLPFRYLLSFPLEILLNKSSAVSYLPSLLIQVVWLLLVILLYRYLWAAGVRRYSASGN